LKARSITVRETVDARKTRYAKKDLAALFAGGERLVVAGKGKTEALVIDLTKKPSADELDVALGPSGNLRAPAIRVGKRWFVGFNSDAFEKHLH